VLKKKDFQKCVGIFVLKLTCHAKHVQVLCKKSGGLTTKFVDSRIFLLKNLKFDSLALEDWLFPFNQLLIGLPLAVVCC
jgi:hypothetical protein